MFSTVANGTEFCRAANIVQNQKSAFWGFVEIFGL